MRSEMGFIARSKLGPDWIFVIIQFNFRINKRSDHHAYTLEIAQKREKIKNSLNYVCLDCVFGMRNRFAENEAVVLNMRFQQLVYYLIDARRD